jgi:predicted dehydrogenase
MEPVKIGVVGAGRMGQRHCRIYANLRHTNLVGICETNSRVGATVAEQYDVPLYENLDDLLTHVDAVSLVTPTPLHFEQARQCLNRGVHVLIEKPITETLEQAESLTEAAEASGQVVQVGHIERFNPAYMELKHVLEGRSVLAVNLRRLSAYEGSNKDVDVILDLMIHDLDLVLDLVGQEPTSVDAYGLSAYGGVLDHVVAQLGFAAGPLLSVTASRITEQKVRSIEVTTLEAYLECDLLNKSIAVHRRTVGEYLSHNQRGVRYRQESIVERIHVPTYEPLFLELQHFVDCVLERKSPAVRARDGLKALRLAETIQAAVYERMAAQGAPKPMLSSRPEPTVLATA